MVRGAERNYETILGDYKEVNGWYLPFSIENGAKGNPNRQKTTYSKIEANLPMVSARFVRPGSGGSVAVETPLPRKLELPNGPLPASEPETRQSTPAAP